MSGYVLLALALWFAASTIATFCLGYVLGQLSVARDQLDRMAPRRQR